MSVREERELMTSYERGGGLMRDIETYRRVLLPDLDGFIPVEAAPFCY